MDKNFIKLLDLDSREQGILSLLSTKPLLASEIAMKRGIPRATLDRVLASLHKRGLVAKHKYSKKRFGWVMGVVQIENKRENVSDYFRVKKLTGIRQMLEETYAFMEKNKKSRCYGIQGDKSWNAWHTTLSPKDNIELNALLAKNDVIMDVIITKTINKKYLDLAYKDRPSMAHVIPSKFLPTPIDIEITNEDVYIMNWESLEGLHIQNKDLAKMLQSLTEYIKTSSEYYNIHNPQQ